MRRWLSFAGVFLAGLQQAGGKTGTCSKDRDETVNDAEIQSSLAACTVEQVLASELSVDSFRNVYAGRRPVVIHGFNENAKFRQLTRKSELLERYVCYTT